MVFILHCTESQFLFAFKCCRKLTGGLRNYTETGSIVVNGLVFCFVKEIRAQAVVSF